MDVLITGVPVRRWRGLRRPTRKEVERFLDAANLEYEEVRVTFFPTYGERFFRIAFDCAPSIRPFLPEIRRRLASMFDSNVLLTGDAWFDPIYDCWMD